MDYGLDNEIQEKWRILHGLCPWRHEYYRGQRLEAQHITPCLHAHLRCGNVYWAHYNYWVHIDVSPHLRACFTMINGEKVKKTMPRIKKNEPIRKKGIKEAVELEKQPIVPHVGR